MQPIQHRLSGNDEGFKTLDMLGNFDAASRYVQPLGNRPRERPRPSRATGSNPG
jgi:hypothetical protein